MNAKLAVFTAIFLVPSASMAITSDVRRVTPSYRPYIVEIGDPAPLGPRALDAETQRNTDLRAYLRFYGWPDYAEIQEIEPEIPWDSYEVRLYYLRRDRELAFGRAYISPNVTDLGIIKYEAAMDPATRDRIVALVTPAANEEPEHVEFKPVAAGETVPPSEIEMMVRRIEAAAERASLAADSAASASEAANASADRTVIILERIAK